MDTRPSPRKLALLLFAAVMVAGCAAQGWESAREQIDGLPTLASELLQAPSVTPVSTRPPQASLAAIDTPTATMTSLPTVVPSPAPAPTAVPTATEAPSFAVITYAQPPASEKAGCAPSGQDPEAASYTGLTIPELAGRSYGGGELEIVETLEELDRFTRYLVRYPSDGLTIYGFMNVPRGPGEFPVVIALHGFVDSEGYDTEAYTTPYADDLTAAGFIVLHPNYRNYPPSDEGENPFRVGYAVDVLNLLALVRAQGGRAGPLLQADSEEINLWGHSMGGAIALKVLVVDPQIRRAVLYAAVSDDAQSNLDRLSAWPDGDPQGIEAQAPPEIVAEIAAANYIPQISAELSLHHGAGDIVAPHDWFTDLCNRLLQAAKDYTCYNYDGQAHIFTGDADRLFRARVREFLTFEAATR